METLIFYTYEFAAISSSEDSSLSIFILSSNLPNKPAIALVFPSEKLELACAAEVWHPAREHSGRVHCDVYPFFGALPLSYTYRFHLGRSLRADGDSLALLQPAARTQAQA